MSDKTSPSRGNIQQQIEANIHGAFADVSFTLLNHSHLHQGHSGDDGSGESHFSLMIDDAAGLSEYSRIEQHRKIHQAIGKELLGHIHALEIKVQKKQKK